MSQPFLPRPGPVIGESTTPPWLLALLLGGVCLAVLGYVVYLSAMRSLNRRRWPIELSRRAKFVSRRVRIVACERLDPRYCRLTVAAPDEDRRGYRETEETPYRAIVAWPESGPLLPAVGEETAALWDGQDVQSMVLLLDHPAYAEAAAALYEKEGPIPWRPVKR